MTGEKNRFNTLEKLGRFNDTSLSTPKHDELVLTLLDEKNIRQLFPEVDTIMNDVAGEISLHFSRSWNMNENAWKLLQASELSTELAIMAILNIKEEDIPRMYDEVEKEKIQFEKKWGRTCCGQWRYCECKAGEQRRECEHIKGSIQQVDLLKRQIDEIKNAWSGLVESLKTARATYKRQIKIYPPEVPITTDRDFIIGYWDVVIGIYDIEYHDEFLNVTFKNKSNFKIYIEVKPEIKSYGEVMRQLRTYKHYTDGETLQYNIRGYIQSLKIRQDYCLFTPDLKFKNQFEMFGFKLISPPITDPED